MSSSSKDTGGGSSGMYPVTPYSSPSTGAAASYGFNGFVGVKKSSKPKSHTNAAARRVSNRSGGGGSSSRKPTYSSGKTVGSSATGRITPVAPPPSYKDTTYQQQQLDSTKALADYMAQMTGQQNNYNTEYTRNTLGLADQQKLDDASMSDDYASRGMSQSGVALKAHADLGTDYGKRQSALDSGKAEYTGNLATGLANFKSTQGINNQRYQNEAINRRIQKYGL